MLRNEGSFFAHKIPESLAVKRILLNWMDGWSRVSANKLVSLRMYILRLAINYIVRVS